MGEKKFLESIEDGELDIAVYARSWEEGDNVTVTCDLLFAMEQAVGVLNEQRAEIAQLKKEKERWKDREKSFVNYFEKAKKEKTELQKQVKELTDKLLQERDMAEMLWDKAERVKKQVVKSTANKSDRKLNGRYRYEDKDDKTNRGEIVLQVKETEKSITFEVLKNDMRYSPAHIDIMFEKSNQVKITKGKSSHAIIYGNDYFVIYPYRAGMPFLFEYVGVE